MIRLASAMTEPGVELRMEANDDMDLNLHDAAWTSWECVVLEAGLDARNPHLFKQCLYLTGLTYSHMVSPFLRWLRLIGSYAPRN